MTQWRCKSRSCEPEFIKESPCFVDKCKLLFNQPLLMKTFFFFLAAKARHDLSGSARPWMRAVQARQSVQRGPRPQSAVNTRGPFDSTELSQTHTLTF